MGTEFEAHAWLMPFSPWGFTVMHEKKTTKTTKQTVSVLTLPEALSAEPSNPRENLPFVGRIILVRVVPR